MCVWPAFHSLLFNSVKYVSQSPEESPESLLPDSYSQKKKNTMLRGNNCLFVTSSTCCCNGHMNTEDINGGWLEEISEYERLWYDEVYPNTVNDSSSIWAEPSVNTRAEAFYYVAPDGDLRGAVVVVFVRYLGWLVVVLILNSSVKTSNILGVRSRNSVRGSWVIIQSSLVNHLHLYGLMRVIPAKVTIYMHNTWL